VARLDTERKQLAPLNKTTQDLFKQALVSGYLPSWCAWDHLPSRLSYLRVSPQKSGAFIAARLGWVPTPPSRFLGSGILKVETLRPLVVVASRAKSRRLTLYTLSFDPLTLIPTALKQRAAYQRLATRPTTAYAAHATLVELESIVQEMWPGLEPYQAADDSYDI